MVTSSDMIYLFIDDEDEHVRVSPWVYLGIAAFNSAVGWMVLFYVYVQYLVPLIGAGCSSISRH